jgi:beta-glucosidase
MFQNKICSSFTINILLIALTSLPNETAYAQYLFSYQDTEQRVNNIVDAMTLEQKIGQMIQGNIKHVAPADVSKYYLGAVFHEGGHWLAGNQSSVDDWLRLADAYYEASIDKTQGGAGIPIIWGSDAVHGLNNLKGATIFPHNIGLGAADDSKLIERIASVTAREVAITGQDWTFSPAVAVAKDMRWGRSFESFSDDSEIIERYSRAVVRGLQGPSHQLNANPWKVIATAKRFIGDGGTFQGIDQGDTRLDLPTLLELHGQGFISAIGEGVQTVMASFNSWNREKLHGNKILLTDVLKGQLGFDGFVIGDWKGHRQIVGCSNDSCPQAINAGIDMLMAPKEWESLIRNTLEQVRSGLISESRVDDAVRRILRVKIRAGILERGLPSRRVAAGRVDVLGSKQHREVARESVRKSLVLLKNNNATLPIKIAQKVLVAGDGAHSIPKQTGGWTLTWQGAGNTSEYFSDATSIYGGLKRAIEATGGSVELAKQDQWVSKPDVAIVVFGEDPYVEGTGDLKDLLFKDPAKTNAALLSKLRTEGVPIVSVFLTGRPLFVNDWINQSDAFVVAWLPGSEGAGVADVLVADRSGKPVFDFVGRLPFPWPNASANKYQSDLPVFSHLFDRGYGLTYSSEVNEMGFALPEKNLDVIEEPIVIFKGTSLSPFSSYVGDPRNWSLLVSGTQTSSLLGGIIVNRVDGIEQEDSWQIEWSGLSEGQIYWAAGSTVDLTGMVDEDAALESIFRVDKSPEGKVKQRMDCGYPCAGEIDMTAFFKGLPEDKWIRAAIPLSCFARSGVDLSRITSPMVLLSSEPFVLTFKDLRITPHPAEDILIGC